MIQRIQTIWLLLAGLAIGFLFRWPLFSGVLADQSKRELMVAENYLLFVVAAVLIVFPLIALVRFKNRKQQKLLIWLSLLLNAVFIALIWMEVDQFKQAYTFTSSVYRWPAILPVLSIILLIMALSAIRRDEKLIKSADRLR